MNDIIIKGDTAEKLQEERLKLFDVNNLPIDTKDFYHSMLENACKGIFVDWNGETRPVVYQEDIMKMFENMAGLQATEGYLLLKACIKKKAILINEQIDLFKKHARQKGYSMAIINSVADFMVKNAEYAISRTHLVVFAAKYSPYLLTEFQY